MMSFTTERVLNSLTADAEAIKHLVEAAILLLPKPDTQGRPIPPPRLMTDNDQPAVVLASLAARLLSLADGVADRIERGLDDGDEDETA